MVALRGSYSTEDLITDAVADPVSVAHWVPQAFAKQHEGAVHAFHAHAGVKGAADAVLKVRTGGLSQRLPDAVPCSMCVLVQGCLRPASSSTRALCTASMRMLVSRVPQTLCSRCSPLGLPWRLDALAMLHLAAGVAVHFVCTGLLGA